LANAFAVESHESNDNDDEGSAVGGNIDHDDPENDAYWVENESEDPGHKNAAPTIPLGGANSDPEDRGASGANNASKIQSGGTQSSKQPRRGSNTAIPRQFPAPEKKLTPRKDFATVYMDAQSQLTMFEREKFEYMKESDKLNRAATADQEKQQAKASMIEKLVVSGVVDPGKIREIVSIAFPEF
jgi:hypothetical protein